MTDLFLLEREHYSLPIIPYPALWENGEQIVRHLKKAIIFSLRYLFQRLRNQLASANYHHCLFLFLVLFKSFSRCPGLQTMNEMGFAQQDYSDNNLDKEERAF